jgi:H+-translocating NAD(P) transhydrogenase subunit alpha
VKIAVLNESSPAERRVALVPESVKKLIALKVEVVVEAGAGEAAFISDDDYRGAGATIAPSRNEALLSADVLATVNRPTADDLAPMRREAIVIGFLRPLDDPAGLEPLIARGLYAFAMELMPRITRAQSMDALSSMATVAGYKAVMLAGDHLPRMFPMLMTAAGTVSPARVLVLGAGVAGLQAIATAHRLGAVVEAYDVRAAAGEQVRSLGATFLEVDLGGIQTEDKGGYAKELTEEALNRGRDLIAKRAQLSDVIITTAQVPGRKAPLLLTEEAVNGMKSGSIVVDLAASTGGNCALTQPGETTITANHVTIHAPLNLAATVPVHASQLYSRNVAAFLALLVKEGKISIDMNDTVVGPACVAGPGGFVNQRVAAALGKPVSS